MAVLRKIRQNQEQIGKIKKDGAERIFEEKAIGNSKTEGLVASSQVKTIVITNVLPPIEEQIEGVLYGIFV